MANADLEAAIREAMDETQGMDDPHRYHMLCTKLLSMLSAFSALDTEPDKQTRDQPCSECGGSGAVRKRRNSVLGLVAYDVDCPRCKGSGVEPDKARPRHKDEVSMHIPDSQYPAKRIPESYGERVELCGRCSHPRSEHRGAAGCTHRMSGGCPCSGFIGSKAEPEKFCTLHGKRDQVGIYCNAPMGTRLSCGRELTSKPPDTPPSDSVPFPDSGSETIEAESLAPSDDSQTRVQRLESAVMSAMDCLAEGDGQGAWEALAPVDPSYPRKTRQPGRICPDCGEPWLNKADQCLACYRNLAP